MIYFLASHFLSAAGVILSVWLVCRRQSRPDTWHPDRRS
jgi:hypothetical protein